MPQINVAMAASLRRGALAPRDIVGEVVNVKNSFSSWDNCMNAAYCKWPVIAAIIIGGLIVLSVVWCIVRCACCGLSCCCSCFSCLKCCGNCCGCCDDPRDRKHKHLDEPYREPYHPPQQGYNAPLPMMTGGVGAHEPPKYAQFETGPNGLAVEPKKVNDDALPPMPSWDTAAKKRIMTEEEQGAVEMGELDPKTGQNVPLMTGAGSISRTGSPAQLSPGHGPYSDAPFDGTQNGHMGAGALGAAAGAGAIGAGAMAMHGRGNGMEPYGRSEHGGFNGAPSDRGYGPPGQTLSPVDGMRRGVTNGAANNRSYGGSGQAVSPIAGPGRGQEYDNQFTNQSNPANPYGPGGFGVAAAAGPYFRPPRQRQYTGSSDASRPFSPPQRQYTNESNRSLAGSSPQRPYYDEAPVPFPAEPSSYSSPSRRPVPERIASPPVNNNSNLNSGFDFGGPSPPPSQSNYGGSGRRPSEPRQQGGGGYAGSTAPPTYASRSPPPQQQQGSGGGYPGYQAYSQPRERERGGPPSSAGRQREAHGWEGV